MDVNATQGFYRNQENQRKLKLYFKKDTINISTSPTKKPFKNWNKRWNVTYSKDNDKNSAFYKEYFDKEHRQTTY